MIKVKFTRDGQRYSFDNYEDIIIYLRAKAGMWRAKDGESNERYKKQVLKRIKRMYGITYANKKQTDEEFIHNLFRLGEIHELLIFGTEEAGGIR